MAHCVDCLIGPDCRGATFNRLCAKIKSDPAWGDHFRVRAGLLPAVDSPVVRVDQELPQMIGDRLVVVARYNEDVAWISQRPVPCLVYNKGAAVQVGPGVGLVHLPNKGREAGSYLRHIVDAYDRLADWTIFVQGTPHNSSVQEFFGRITAQYQDATSLTSEYSPIFPHDSIKALDMQEWHAGYSVRLGIVNPLEPDYCPAARLPCSKLWNHFFISPQPDPWHFGYGAQWIVPKHRITARPLAFWRWCLDQVERTSSTMAGDLASAWSFEMLWRYLFGDATTYQVRMPEDRPVVAPEAAPAAPRAGCSSCGGVPRAVVPPAEEARRQAVRDRLKR